VNAPAPQLIADWLATLGMSEYAHRFAENGIDVSVLQYLTDQDLEKIGVLLGHRLLVSPAGPGATLPPLTTVGSVILTVPLMPQVRLNSPASRRRSTRCLPPCCRRSRSSAFR
jgi:hypothetical protein